MRALVLAVGALLAPALAHADDEIVRGTVVKIEAQEIYVNIGVDQRRHRRRMRLRIKRPVSLRHPVTRAPIQDWIPIGSASVTQAGAVMSRAVVGELVDATQGRRHRRGARRSSRLAAGPDRSAAAEAREPAADAARSIRRPPRCSACSPRRRASRSTRASRRGSATCRCARRRRTPPAIRRDLDQLHALREELQPRDAVAERRVDRSTVEHEPPKACRAGDASAARVRARSARARSRARICTTARAATARIAACCSSASTTSICAARCPPRS